MTSAPKVWGDALRLLQDEIPDFAFEAWIAPIAVKLSDERVVLGCPTTFHRERIRTHFSALIQRCWGRAWEASPLLVEAWSEDKTARAETRLAPPIAIVDMKEFSAVAGHPIELRLPIRRAEPVALASGALGALRRSEMSAQAVAVHAGERSHSSVAIAIESISSSARPAEPTAGAGLPGLHEVLGKTVRSEPPHRTPLRDERRKEKDRGNERSDVLRVEAAPRFGLDGESAQGELPFSFESFVVGPCNALAREAALALARRRQDSLNQLYLGGESGMGKTHLARAAAIEARRQVGASPTGRGASPASRCASPSGRGSGSSPAAGSRSTFPGRPGVVYTTAEQFTSEFVSAMRNGRSEDFQKRYRGPIGLLIVEDVQFFEGRMKTQLELFHTVQHVLDAGGRVLLTGDRSPRDLTGLSERMRTQLTRGFVAELERPDAIVRRHILRAKAAAGGGHLPADCLDQLVESTGGSVRDVESVLIQVVTTASLLGRTIDLALTREAIARKAGTNSPVAPRRVATSEIVRIVAAFFGKRPEALAARSRRRDVLVPRQLAMYLAHRYTDASFAEIGRSLGRDHPSVRNAIVRVERLVLESAPLRYQVEALSERVDQSLANRRSTPAAPDA
jgi:chromosomal replication initiator protein